MRQPRVYFCPECAATFTSSLEETRHRIEKHVQKATPMQGYAEMVFTRDDRELLRQAQEIVSLLPPDDRLRCHEVARIVAQILRLDVFDGYYGAIEHSWCMTPARSILDPYCVGRLPMVQLVDNVIGAMPYTAERRPDITVDHKFVIEMTAHVLAVWAKDRRG